MQSLSALAPVANAKPFPPITRADLARAAMWKLKLPDAPMAVEPAVEPNPRDFWPDWTDEDIWNAAGDDEFAAGPADRPEASDLDLTGFATRAGDAPAKLAIHGFTYEAREVPAGECGSVAFEVLKVETNNRYHVIRDHHGIVSCSCPDYLFRHEGTAGLCKHAAKLVELGLIPAPTPIPSTVGRREFVAPTVSVARDNFPERTYYPAPKSRRFDPSPEEMAEAAQLFGDLATGRASYRRELAAAL